MVIVKRKTKKERILEMFNNAEWHQSNSYAAKTLTYEDFQNADLAPSFEYQEKYCDVIYARQIFKKMGYGVGIGMAFHIYDYSQKNSA